MDPARPTNPHSGNLSLDTIAAVVPRRSWLVYVALLALLLQWAVSPLLCREGGGIAKPQPPVDDGNSSLALGASTESAINQKQQRLSPSPPHSKSATWSDIFSGTQFRIGELSPHQFYEELSSLSSVEISDKLQDGELKGRHIRSYLSSVRITLEPDEDDVDVSILAEKYGYDRLNLYMIERAFVGSELYNAIDNAVCAILAEDGTHTMLLGDSTISNMMMKVMDGFACEKKQNATISIASKEDTAEKRKTEYVFRRAYADGTAKIDYTVPEGTKRALVITNFEGLHSLSLYPVRPFEEIIANGRPLFHVWDDYIRYELWQVSRMPVETFLVTANQNAVDNTRMRGEYARYSKVYQQDPVGYGKRCSAAWNVSAATCRNSVFTNDGIDYLNRWLPNITRVDVDVNALTKGRGYLSKPKDGRHYWNLGRLKVVQFLVVYLLRRIERFFHQGGRGQEQQQQFHF